MSELPPGSFGLIKPDPEVVKELVEQHQDSVVKLMALQAGYWNSLISMHAAVLSAAAIIAALRPTALKCTAGWVIGLCIVGIVAAGLNYKLRIHIYSRMVMRTGEWETIDKMYDYMLRMGKVHANSRWKRKLMTSAERVSEGAAIMAIYMLYRLAMS